MTETWIASTDLATDTQSAPAVSVLMTTFNGSGFIHQSIDSVLAQTMRDFELLVVDDNSSDGTGDLLARYTDPRLRVIRNASNLGVVGARNLGFAFLRGRYVATIDHDDLWLPNRLQAGLECLDRHPAAVLVATRTQVLRGTSLHRPTRPERICPLLFQWMLLFECPVVYSSLLFRRSVARRADGTFLRPDLRYADDHELMLRMASAGEVEVVDDALTIYRVHGRNTTLQVADEMYSNAVKMLTERFSGWLGDDANEAAKLIAWQVSRRHPATTFDILRRLYFYVDRLSVCFQASIPIDPASRSDIEEYTADLYWSVLRASIRSGRVWLIAQDWRRSVTSHRMLRRPFDLLVSVAVGLLRMPLCLISPRETPVPGATGR